MGGMKTESPEFEVLPAAGSRDEKLVRWIAHILDDLIPIPGTKFRIGLDPVIGLIPGIGEASSTTLASMILFRAVQAGVPRVVLVRMAMNLLLNALIGAIPGLGDVFSAWFKSNRRNHALLERHKNSARASTAGDWTFLIVILSIILAIALTATLALGYLAFRVMEWLIAA